MSELIRVFFQPENKYGIFLRPKNKFCIYFCAGQRLDRAGGQSGQKSVHLVKKKLSDFNRLALTLFDSVRFVQYGKFRYFSKWLKSCTFFWDILYYYFILDSNKKIYTPCKAVGRDRKIEYISYKYICVFSEALSTRSRNPLILFQIRDKAGQSRCNLLILLMNFLSRLSTSKH